MDLIYFFIFLFFYSFIFFSLRCFFIRSIFLNLNKNNNNFLTSMHAYGKFLPDSVPRTLFLFICILMDIRNMLALMFMTTCKYSTTCSRSIYGCKSFVICQFFLLYQERAPSILEGYQFFLSALQLVFGEFMFLLVFWGFVTVNFYSMTSIYM